MTSRHEDDELPSIDEFGERLDKSRHKESGANGMRGKDSTELGRAFRIGTELLAALLVAGAIGLGLDRLFGTQPWLMLVGLALGFAAGLLNVQRAMGDMKAALEEDGKDE